jgi:hypothetical protein
VFAMNFPSNENKATASKFRSCFDRNGDEI